MRRSELISFAILSVALVIFSLALFYIVRFYTTLSPHALSFQSEMASFNYALWRASLLPTALMLLALGFAGLLLSVSFYPLSPKRRNIFTLFMLAFLEEQLAVWGSWLASHVPEPWTLWSYDPFPLLYSVIGGSVALCFLLLSAAALVTVQIKFRSIARTLQIMSLSLFPLPLYVYFFDPGEFYIHFQSALTSLGFITNSDLLVACLAVFSISTAYRMFRNKNFRK